MIYGNLTSFYYGRPNDFTRAMGGLIKKARVEAGLSQDDLSKKAGIRQASVSDLENGKMEASALDLIYISQALEKPIIYFFPEWTIQKLSTENIPSELEILLINAKKLPKDDIRKIIIQVKALVANLKENS